MTRKSYTIGIDCRFANANSGIGRYTRELISRLKKRNDEFNYVPLANDIPHYSLKEQTAMPGKISEAKIDLLHVPSFNVPILCPVPFIVTIHDLILHRYPNDAPLIKRAAYKFLISHAVRKARRIIAVSAYTAKRLSQAYGDGIASKTSVIYEGVSSGFIPAANNAAQQQTGASRQNAILDAVRKPYLLYVGASKQHKNVQTLIDACPANMNLVLVTGGRESKMLHPRPNTCIMENVDDNSLPFLYASAACFVTASFEEGFGLPVLEAMACGCPVIASNRSSLPEICNGHAVLAEPTVEGIRNAITKISEIDAAAAMKHARSFSWERMTRETVDIYRRALGV